MNKRKVCVVITARPSYSRIKSALTAIKESADLELYLVLTASAVIDRYGNVAKVVERDGFEIAEKVHCSVESSLPLGMVKTTGLSILDLGSVFSRVKPDIVVTIADRFETLATSIAASYQNIPLVHIQGGEVTGSIDEKVRHANTKLADIHFVATEAARNNVVGMGEVPGSVHNVGCPSVDLARDVFDSPVLDFNPVEKYTGVGDIHGWHDNYVVVLQHSVTSEYDKAGQQISETLHAVYQLGLPVFWFWPNIDVGTDGLASGIRHFREHHPDMNAYFIKNMDSTDFLKLCANAKCLIGNSSVGVRECSYLGVPVINIGDRQEGRERADNVIDCDYSRADITDAISEQVRHGSYSRSTLYGNGQSGARIAKLLGNIELGAKQN
jgi:UDP-hydrolysing UDP-N-acetyl-D-glucosamine 2-epimerase